MSCDELKAWLASGRYARVDGLSLRPHAHRLWPDIPLMITRGQAVAIFLVADDGSAWILKKFHEGRCPDASYLRAVSSLLPRHDGLTSGTDRRVLSASELKDEPGCYYSTELQRWFEGTVLMPRVPGMDWAGIADEIRDGRLRLNREQRVQLCRNLAALVQLLEAAGLAHRDISSGNAFILLSGLLVILIDFDSLYHASFQMPEVTTCGTEGYAHPSLWRDGRPQCEATWCLHADRYPLAVMSVEFLALDQGAPLGAEGGMFDQPQLCARDGQTVRLVRRRLGADFPEALSLFDAAINSQRCTDCPAPGDWLRFCESTLGPAIQAPPLQVLDLVSPEDFIQVLQRRIPAAPVWPAPKLEDLPSPQIQLRPADQCLVPLPDDPWASGIHQVGRQAPSPRVAAQVVNAEEHR